MGILINHIIRISVKQAMESIWVFFSWLTWNSKNQWFGSHFFPLVKLRRGKASMSWKRWWNGCRFIRCVFFYRCSRCRDQNDEELVILKWFPSNRMHKMHCLGWFLRMTPLFIDLLLCFCCFSKESLGVSPSVSPKRCLNGPRSFVALLRSGKCSPRSSIALHRRTGLFTGI